MDCFKICTYNCKNFRGPARKEFIADMFKKCDILLLQEHWLYESQFHLFDELCTDTSIMYIGKSSMDPAINRIGRPFGGNCIIWRANLKSKITEVKTSSSRLSCIHICLNSNVDMLLFNVYMPCDVGRFNENVCEFQDVLAEIMTICASKNPKYVCIGGDLNTDFSRKRSFNTRELISFCEAENVQSCCHSTMSNVNYTFECCATGTRSLIDHCIVSKNLVQYMSRCYVMNSIENGSDHLPVFTDFTFPCDYINVDSVRQNPKVAWYKASLQDIDMYKRNLDRELDNIVLPLDACMCRDLKCKEHDSYIESFHNSIVNACVSASRVLPSTGSANTTGTNTKMKPFPGWNELCKNKRKDAIHCHNLWKRAGRPRMGELFFNRKKTRAEYHRAVKLAKVNENKIRSEHMARNIAESKTRNFWKEVKLLKGKGRQMPIAVDGATGDEGIADIFASKFKTIFNTVPSDAGELSNTHTVIEDATCNMTAQCIEDSLMSVTELRNIIKRLKSGKSDGGLGVFSDNIINGTEKLFEYLTYLFNSTIVHCVAPTEMLTGTMIPIPKGKRLNISVSDNFRGICLQSHLCKILDIFMLKRESSSLSTSNTQFGFKEKLSASLATSLVTETVDYYNARGGRVYGLALDATKAFDRVEFDKLFNILLKRKFNPIYMRLMFNMYVNQKVRVKYNQTFSEYFSVCNGVKQGGVISPTLFTCYVDNMLENLKDSGLGCNIGSAYTGCVSYADDLILLAPTFAALKGMIKICEEFATEHKILFNGSKCKLIDFSRDGNTMPIITVAEQTVEEVPHIKYLGHKLHADRSDPHFDYIRRDFFVKFNSFIGDLGHLSSDIKQTLFQTYCMSLYGVNIGDFESKGMESLCTEWRKSVRRIWKIPPRTHCRLLYHIIQAPPPDVIIMQRFIHFFFSGLRSLNPNVSFIFKQAICSHSRLGSNLKFILGKLSFNVCNTSSFDPNVICGAIYNNWFSNVCQEDVRVGCQIRELILMRDSYIPNYFKDNEFQDIISYLCTVD